MTTPSTGDIKQAAALACAMRGCTCTPDITIEVIDGINHMHIAHDEHCRAIEPEQKWN